MTTETRYRPEVQIKLDETAITAPGVKKSDISHEFATRAYYGTSMSPEERGYRQQLDYINHMNAVYTDLSKRAKTDEQKALLNEEFERYRQGYIKHQNEYLASHSRIVSAFIAGPSKFPGRQMQKRNEATDNKAKEWMDWDERAQKAIAKKLNPTQYAISSDRPEAADLLKQKLATEEKLHSTMVEANKIMRGKESKEEKIKKIVALGVSEATAEKFFGTDVFHRGGFQGFELSNSSANIKRIKERIADIESKRGQTSQEIPFANGTIIDSVEDNRIQIKYDGKPDYETIKKLKSRGFHWTPSLGVWQRMRGTSANYAVQDITGVKVEPKKEQSKPVEAEPEAVKMPEIKEEPEAKLKVVDVPITPQLRKTLEPPKMGVKEPKDMDKGELIKGIMEFVPKDSELYKSTEKNLSNLHQYELRDSLIELRKKSQLPKSKELSTKDLPDYIGMNKAIHAWYDSHPEKDKLAEDDEPISKRPSRISRKMPKITASRPRIGR